MGRKPIYYQVYNRLRYQILSGEWVIGSAVPPERKLAEQLGVSRNTIVRAYEELQADGFIASKMGSGRYVLPLQPVSSLPQLKWQEVATVGSLCTAPSNMAELLAISATNPNAINFAHGDGGKHTWTDSTIHRYIEQAAKLADAYYFAPVSGHQPLREWVVHWMAAESVYSPEQVLITSGSQEALYYITRLLTKPGEAITLEMPTYFGSLQLFQSLGLRIIPIPLDRDGMRIDVLEGVLARYRPKFVYTIPTFHNPTGCTLSLERRKRLVTLSEQYQIPIIEDDAYRHLHLAAEPPPALKSLDQSGIVIYVNTFSKVLFPGLRIGWIAASRPFVQLCTRLKELSISTNTVSQYALAAYLADGALPPHLESVRCHYREQSAAMNRQLAALHPFGVRYEEPAGGFYYWVALPDNMDARALMQSCLNRGVAFASGDMFLLRDAVQPYLRLCFTHETADKIQQGMNVIKEMLLTERSVLV